MWRKGVRYEIAVADNLGGIGGVQRRTLDAGAKESGQTQTQASSRSSQGQPKAGDVQNAPAQRLPRCPRRMTARLSTTAAKTDVDAVGNRNVGCGRGVGNWYTVEGR